MLVLMALKHTQTEQLSCSFSCFCCSVAEAETEQAAGQGNVLNYIKSVRANSCQHVGVSTQQLLPWCRTASQAIVPQAWGYTSLAEGNAQEFQLG